jgi:hypothetical protein
MRNEFLLASLLVAVPSVAQTGAQEKAPNPNVVRLSPSVTIPAAVSKLAAPTGALVAVDPSIEEKVPASYAEGDLETGLKRIADLRRLQYRKLYLDAASIPKIANKGLDAAKLKAWAIALDTLGAASVGLEKGGVLAVASHQPAGSPEAQAWMKGRTPVHVLYRTDQPPARPLLTGERPADGRMPEPLDTTGMSPEKIAEAYRAGQPVALDFATARKLKEMYPGLLPDIRLDLPEGANGRIVLMRRDEGGGRQIEVNADVLRGAPQHP